jgi:DNA-binding transcriptional ArsR family regulator
MKLADTFKALGDPVRLKMIERLSSGESYTVGHVSSGMPVSRQGARKHLQVLADAGLVTLESIGRETNVKIDVAALNAAKSFIEEMELRWDHRLLALRNFVENGSDKKRG